VCAVLLVRTRFKKKKICKSRLCESILSRASAAPLCPSQGSENHQPSKLRAAARCRMPRLVEGGVPCCSTLSWAAAAYLCTKADPVLDPKILPTQCRPARLPPFPRFPLNKALTRNFSCRLILVVSLYSSFPCPTFSLLFLPFSP
jgi:hypothetical protein